MQPRRIDPIRFKIRGSLTIQSFGFILRLVPIGQLPPKRHDLVPF
jgi:hypothetical protein